MTPENFVYWLKGILEDNETNKLEPKKFKKIKEKLLEVTGHNPPPLKSVLADATSDIPWWTPYWSSWSIHPMKRHNATLQELKSDPPVLDYKQGESV